MATVEAVDLECGYGGGGGSRTDDDDDDIDSSVCFSDAEEGSCYSQFYSTADGDVSFDEDDDEILEEAMDSQSVSSLADSDCSVDVEKGFGKTKVHSRKQEKDCRICHLSLVSTSSDPEHGIAIELGCSCKDDLAAAHKHCAETWFKIKGNKTCEICNSIARNVVGPNDIESGQQSNNNSNATAASTTTTEPGESTSDTQRGCFDGRFANFLLACMLFAFVLSWLFHFNVHS